MRRFVAGENAIHYTISWNIFLIAAPARGFLSLLIRCLFAAAGQKWLCEVQQWKTNKSLDRVESTSTSYFSLHFVDPWLDSLVCFVMCAHSSGNGSRTAKTPKYERSRMFLCKTVSWKWRASESSDSLTENVINVHIKAVSDDWQKCINSCASWTSTAWQHFDVENCLFFAIPLGEWATVEICWKTIKSEIELMREWI